MSKVILSLRDDKLILVTLFILLSTAGCDFLKEKFSGTGSSAAIAQVGQFKITQQMVDDRDKIIKLQFPQETRSMGLQQLQRAYTDAQILINNGHSITDEVLAREEARIDKSTLMPEKLQEVKNIFGSRREDYRKVFILPVYAQRVIYYEFFLNDPKVQAEPLRKAQEFKSRVDADIKQWSQLVKEFGLTQAKARVSLSGGFELKQKLELKLQEFFELVRQKNIRKAA